MDFALADAIPVLRQTPAVLRALLWDVPEPWVRSTARGKSLRQLLDTFAELRAANLTRLQSLGLTPEDLERRGRHPELGPCTLGELLATWVAHDLSHIAQIVRVMGKQYTEAVGPWRAYLPMLDNPRR